MNSTLFRIGLFLAIGGSCVHADAPAKTIDLRLAAQRAELKAKISPYFNAALSKSGSVRLAAYALQLRDYNVFYEMLDKASSAKGAAFLLPHYAFCLSEDGDIEKAKKIVAEIDDYDGVWFGNRLDTIDLEEFRRRWDLQANRGYARWLATHGRIDDAIELEKRCIKEAKDLDKPIELSILGLSRYCARANLVDECVQAGEGISNHPQVFVAMTESRLPFDELVQFIAKHKSKTPNLVAAGLSIAERYSDVQARKLMRLEYELEKPKMSVYQLIDFHGRVAQVGDDEFAAQLADNIQRSEVPFKHYGTYVEFLTKLGLTEKAKAYLESLSDEFEENIADCSPKSKDFYLRRYAQRRIDSGLLEDCLLYTSPSPRD